MLGSAAKRSCDGHFGRRRAVRAGAGRPILAISSRKRTRARMPSRLALSSAFLSRILPILMQGVSPSFFVYQPLEKKELTVVELDNGCRVIKHPVGSNTLSCLLNGDLVLLQANASLFRVLNLKNGKLISSFRLPKFPHDQGYLPQTAFAWHGYVIFPFDSVMWIVSP